MSILKRMNWDEGKGQILDQDRRYVLLRADVLMGLFDQLEGTTERRKALEAFQQSVTLYGSNSVEAYWGEIDHDADRLLNSMMTISAQLGWGVWSLLNRSNNSIKLEVFNSPFAMSTSIKGQTVCYPIKGIMLAMGKLIFNGEVKVVEDKCAVQKQGDTSCFFTIMPLSNTDA